MTTIVSDLVYLQAARLFETRKMRRSDQKVIWTRKREDALKDLHALGIDVALIGLDLGLGEQTVRRRLKQLGLRR